MGDLKERQEAFCFFASCPGPINRGEADTRQQRTEYYETSKFRFFVIKTFSEDDIHRSVKLSVWSGGESSNRRLDSAFRGNKSGKDGGALRVAIDFLQR